jgi:hypothetical protein
MNLIETGWDVTDHTDLAQDRGKWCAMVNMIINLQVP